MYIDLNKNIGFLYENLYRAIKEKILSQEIKAGQALPSIRSLARDLNISINTVKYAYDQLEMEGYLESRPRSGFYVKNIDHLIVLDDIKLKAKKPKKEDPIHYDFSFSGVDPDHFPFATWRKMLRESVVEGDESLLERGHHKGYLPLRMAISEYLKKSRGIDANPENVIISSGTESLFNLVKNLLDPHTLYAFENPGYAFGNKFYTYDLVNPIPLSLDDQGVKIRSIRQINACCLFVTPHHQFPMGTVMSIQRRVEVLNWASASDKRYIIEDDYEPEFKLDGSPVPALKSMDQNDDVIYMGTFSKIISPALRISYMVLPDALLDIYEENFVSLGCPVSLYIQKATANFISQGYFERHINRMKNVYADKYDYMVKRLRAMDRVEIVSQGASLALVIRVKTAMDSQGLTARLREKTVKIQGVQTFAFNQEGYEDLYILGFASLTKAQIKAGLKLLEETLEDQ